MNESNRGFYSKRKTFSAPRYISKGLKLCSGLRLLLLRSRFPKELFSSSRNTLEKTHADGTSPVSPGDATPYSRVPMSSGWKEWKLISCLNKQLIPENGGNKNQGSRKTPRNTFWNTVEDSGTVGRAEKDKLKEPKPLVPPQPYSWLHTQGPKDERRELHAVRYRETNTHLSYV